MFLVVATAARARVERVGVPFSPKQIHRDRAHVKV